MAGVKQRKSKKEAAAQKQLDRLFQNALAKSRRKDAKDRAKTLRQNQKEMNLLRRKQKRVKRDLSQIKFPHWWKERAFIQRLAENKIRIEEQKAAVWYEAARRRPEVQKAWLKGQSLAGDNGWQYFTGWVVTNLLRSWPELEPVTKRSIIKSSYSQWSVPPEGCSTFPTDKAEQVRVAMQVLRLPESNDPDAAQRFVEHARRFADQGFLIVAVDKKQNQAVRAAFEAIGKLPPTFRKADLKEVVFHHLPPDISDTDRQVLAGKQKKGTLTQKDFGDLWRKYSKPTNNLHAEWQKTAEVQERVFHKRQRRGKLIEETQFNFENICRQLESFDNGTISDFINAVRL
jgi:hypothetical protein